MMGKTRGGRSLENVGKESKSDQFAKFLSDCRTDFWILLNLNLRLLLRCSGGAWFERHFGNPDSPFMALSSFEEMAISAATDHLNIQVQPCRTHVTVQKNCIPQVRLLLSFEIIPFPSFSLPLPSSPFLFPSSPFLSLPFQPSSLLSLTGHSRTYQPKLHHYVTNIGDFFIYR